ncbi:hypothetical protein N7478_012403 [Penicillium angulare]|uniref:uncharacterized protein n=1 Tax=Penicillium angulare TaxID=116970 RepID=UPI002542354D|nr:uncharacterized protein N7478_012403 [Penicillium angulare]KAJ5259422.1 hypothetical protein N7478_012403 [Penicillium angulare]
MIATTLMTFLLTTTPDIRSVKLLGSWDNFSKPYAMERDKRMGAGHWRGCHTFMDTMGDGPDKNHWRAGGLKMGATYWYFYLLNDDVEFYSEAEPVTTKCPLLPGQPLNVLNVPIILPDSRAHGRSNSGSSQKEDYRTMNPEDKFMNPRKPPKPDLARLQTSIPSPDQDSSNTPSTSPFGGLIHRSISQPNSARRYNQSNDGRSKSPPRGLGLRHALTQKRSGPSPRANAYAFPEPPRRENLVVNEHRNVPGICVNSGPVSPSAKHTEGPAASTIQDRRALKATGGNAGQSRNLLTVDTRTQKHKPSVAKSAGNSSNPSSTDSQRAMKDTQAFSHTRNGSDDMTPTGPDVNDKRLPSLPNTPSSVMDEAVRAIDEKDRALEAQVLHSHFSSMTADESTTSRFVAEHSRFSEWSTDTETTEDNSPESMVSNSTFPIESYDSPAPEEWTTPDLSSNDTATNTDPNTPHLTVHSKPSSPNSASGDIPWLPQLTVSMSDDRFSGSGLGIDQMDEVERNPKRHAALFSALESMEALSLAQSRGGSPILVQENDSHESGAQSRRSDASSFRGKATMQEMMDELTYLKNMIQAEMDGEPF